MEETCSSYATCKHLWASVRYRCVYVHFKHCPGKMLLKFYQTTARNSSSRLSSSNTLQLVFLSKRKQVKIPNPKGSISSGIIKCIQQQKKSILVFLLHVSSFVDNSPAAWVEWEGTWQRGPFLLTTYLQHESSEKEHDNEDQFCWQLTCGMSRVRRNMTMRTDARTPTVIPVL